MDRRGRRGCVSGGPCVFKVPRAFGALQLGRMRCFHSLPSLPLGYRWVIITRPPSLRLSVATRGWESVA